MMNDILTAFGNAEEMVTVSGMFGVASAIISLVISVAFVVLMIASWWNVYDKMGEKGWKCLIPFYGRYTLFACVWEAKIYFISLALNVVSFCMSVYGIVILTWQIFAYMMESVGVMMGVDIAALSAYLPTEGGLGILLFSILFSLASLCVKMILNWRMVKCFGYGIGFFLGITFFPAIFVPILAFGNAYFDYY